MATPARDKLEKVGIDAICERIRNGDTHDEIAEDYGVSEGTLSNWLNHPSRYEQTACAREESAEAWCNRGLSVLKDALSKSSDCDPSVARAIDQHCRMRAALRNPRYRENTVTEHTGRISISDMSDAELQARARGELK